MTARVPRAKGKDRDESTERRNRRYDYLYSGRELGPWGLDAYLEVKRKTRRLGLAA